MREFSAEKLIQLQANTENIRNICILAHVDHGDSPHLHFFERMISNSYLGLSKQFEKSIKPSQLSLLLNTSCLDNLFRSLQKAHRLPR